MVNAKTFDNLRSAARVVVVVLVVARPYLAWDTHLVDGHVLSQLGALRVFHLPAFAKKSRCAEHFGRGARSRSECPFELDAGAQARTFADDFISAPILEMSIRDLPDEESANAAHPTGASTANVLDMIFISSTAYELLPCTDTPSKLHEVVGEPLHEALVTTSSTGYP